MSDPFPDYDDKTQELAVQENRVLDLEQEVDLLKMDLEKFAQHNMDLLVRAALMESVNGVLLDMVHRIDPVRSEMIYELTKDLEREGREALKAGQFINRKGWRDKFASILEHMLFDEIGVKQYLEDEK